MSVMLEIPETVSLSDPHPPDRHVIVRSRLLNRIGHPPHVPITMVTAAAGYGKSTLALQWAQQSGHPVAWIPLTPASNTLSVLCAAIADALNAALGQEPGEREMFISVDAILQHLQALAARGVALTLVLDDCHVMTNPDVHEALNALLAQLPARIAVILLSRTQVPFALGRLRAEGRVRQLTETDLAFTAAETDAVVATTIPERLTAVQIVTLNERTEGWIAGIQLALASLAHVDARAVQSIVDTRTANRWLDDYIVEEVLAELPAEVRVFVEQTTMLTELTPELCDYVLETQTSARLLAEVDQHLIFVRPADPGGDALTYHALFAESVERMMTRQRSAKEIKERHQRAAAWYVRTERLEVALDHALAGEDFDEAERIVQLLCRPLIETSRSHSVMHFLRKLPESSILKHPELSYWYVRHLMTFGQIRKGTAILQRVEPGWLSSGDPAQVGYAMSSRTLIAAFDGKIDETIQRAYCSLHHFPRNRVVERLHAWSAVAVYEGIRGNDEIAQAAFRQAEHCKNRLPANQYHWHLHTAFERANLYALRGDLNAASTAYRYQIHHLPPALKIHEAKFHYRLVAIQLEQNELGPAAGEMESIFHAIEEVAPSYWHLEARMLMAQLQRAEEKHAQAWETLRHVLIMAERVGVRNVVDRALALQAKWWIEEDDLALAQAWEQRVVPGQHRWANAFGDVNTHIPVVQLRIAEGRYTEASTLTEMLSAEATRTRRWAELIPLQMWHAVARRELEDEAGAAAALGVALHYGRSGGFVQSLATQGHDLRLFLRDAAQAMPTDAADYLRQVLEKGAWSIQEPGNGTKMPVPDLLSKREMDVVALLALGLTNREVGERLFISELTVKRHVSRMFVKLQVSGRAAAVQKAQALGILREPPTA